MMIKPSIEQLTKGQINRYELVIATSKVARAVTDEYVEQREKADKLVATKQTDKTVAALIDEDLRDKKAVENAVWRLYDGTFKVKG
ncbi:MAG: hypothetical protein MJ236_01025 [Clostridia bacterium]|nr:hypothetical protein [Clostridia bacterium]